MGSRGIILAAATAGLTLASITGNAADLPGEGVSVSPIKGSPANAWFQHMVVQIALEKLDHEVDETLEADFPALHLAVASGDADYTVNCWRPLHNGFFDKSGGEDTMSRVKAVSPVPVRATTSTRRRPRPRASPLSINLRILRSPHSSTATATARPISRAATRAGAASW